MNKDDLKLILSVVVGSAILLGVFIWLSKPPSSVEKQAEIAQALVRENSIVEGPQDAKVTLVEFADLQCPACAVAHGAISQIRKEYKDRIRYVFRHYPLTQHKNAQVASYAVESAGLQSKFFEYQDLLFTKQKEWENESDPGAKFIAYAKELKLDEAKFKEGLTNPQIAQKITTEVVDGNLVGVQGTPTIFINGQQYDGDLSYVSLKAEIENLLK